MSTSNIVAKRKTPKALLQFEKFLRSKDDPQPFILVFLKFLEGDQKLSAAFSSALQKETALIAQLRDSLEPGPRPKIPVAPGREIADGPYPDERGWLRLEYVPCGRERCKKQPDKHGPYWYRYERVGASWRSSYIGRSPSRIPPNALDETRIRLGRLSKKKSLTSNELREVCDLIGGLESIEGDEAQSVRAKARTVLDAESKRRKAEAAKDHESLLKKTLAGKQLTEEEYRILQTTAEVLSWEH